MQTKRKKSSESTGQRKSRSQERFPWKRESSRRWFETLQNGGLKWRMNSACLWLRSNAVSVRFCLGRTTKNGRDSKEWVIIGDRPLSSGLKKRYPNSFLFTNLHFVFTELRWWHPLRRLLRLCARLLRSPRLTLLRLLLLLFAGRRTNVAVVTTKIRISL